MPPITRLFPYARELPGKAVTTDDIEDLLRGLNRKLEAKALRWRDVSLLMVFNSKAITDPLLQHDSDTAVIDGLRHFCDEQAWFPSLIGCTVLGGFYADGDDRVPEVNDGVILIAVVNPVFRRVPVGVERTEEREERPRAGTVALLRAVEAYRLALERDLKLTNVPSHTYASTSTGIVLSSGSGHMENIPDVDFKDCYAVGQELLKDANEIQATLFGGCATNKWKNQCLYFSTEASGRIRYESTYRHGAMVALIPHTPSQAHLAHPYTPAPGPKLEIDFSPKDQYKEDRFFLVRQINSRPVTEFLEQYWPTASEDLDDWASRGTAIPGRPETHGVTIASAATRSDEDIWPNVAVWLERHADEILLRLVRAESREANHFLMEMAPTPRDALRRNAHALMETLEFRPAGRETTVLAFLCESRKHLLQLHGSNIEAETMLERASPNAPVIGIYINGEYSTGASSSIGYHNYSQTAALVPPVEMDNLPGNVTKAMNERDQAESTTLFMCHASPDKFTVRAFADELRHDLGDVRSWIDEREIRVGDDLRAVLQDAVRSASFVIPMLTESSARSDWMQRELLWALEQEAHKARLVVLPVVLDLNDGEVFRLIDQSWSPALVASLRERLQLVIRSTEESEYREKAQRLARDIRAHLDGRDPSDG